MCKAKSFILGSPQMKGVPTFLKRHSSPTQDLSGVLREDLSYFPYSPPHPSPDGFSLAILFTNSIDYFHYPFITFCFSHT